jgi:tetratricopeptide (TPR) repeat protein
MRHLLLLAVSFLLSCNGKPEKQVARLSAKNLNDSAVSLAMSWEVREVSEAVGLLDKALEIDPEYFTAYWNKASFLCTLKKYNDALATIDQAIQLDPNRPGSYFFKGTICDAKDDSVNAKICYQKDVECYNALLDTLSPRSKWYRSAQMNKAVDLLCLGKKEGKELLLKLYNDEANADVKDALQLFLNSTRADLRTTVWNINRLSGWCGPVYL